MEKESATNKNQSGKDLPHPLRQKAERKASEPNPARFDDSSERAKRSRTQQIMIVLLQDMQEFFGEETL